MLTIIAVLFVFFNLFYFIGLLKKDFSIIDVAWGLSFLLIFLVGFQSHDVTTDTRLMIIGILVAIWAFRLSGYILFRSIKKGEEDFRYAAWRKEWGDKVNQIAYVKVYMLQMILSLIIASPLILIFKFKTIIQFGTPLDILGVTLWLVGFFFESVGDSQKNKFKSKPENKNKFCSVGLWRYTRHPNYFGEALLWWGIFFISINIVPLYFAVWGPLILNFLLLKVSGVAMLEESYKERPGFEEYKQVTNRFIPWIRQERK